MTANDAAPFITGSWAPVSLIVKDEQLLFSTEDDSKLLNIPVL